MSSSPTQAPTVREIRHRLIEILSAGPLGLDDIAGRLVQSFSGGHEDAASKVFMQIVESVEVDGEERYRILPEYAIDSSSETEIEENEENVVVKEEEEDEYVMDVSTEPQSDEHDEDVVVKIEEEDEPASSPPQLSSRYHRSTTPSPTPSLSLLPLSPIAPKLESVPASPLTSPLSSPPTNLHSPTPTPSPSPSPSPTLSSPLSSPPATSDLHSPTPTPTPSPSPSPSPAPKKTSTRRPANKKPSSLSSTSKTASKVQKNTTKGKGKARATSKKQAMQRVQCSGITKRKTQCKFRKMCDAGESWNCGRHS